MATQADADLRRYLREQIQFLVNSCRAFDEGFDGEARRLAVAVRLLLHDTRQSTSLLVQLRRKAGMRFWDTGYPLDERNLVPDACLVVMRIDAQDGEGTVTWLARCIAPQGEVSDGSPAPRLVDFNRWWDGRVIRMLDGGMAPAVSRVGDEPEQGSVRVEFSIPIRDGRPVQGRETIFTRRQLVLQLANKDGGAHVDPRLDNDYAKLSRIDGLGWKLIDATGERGTAGPELPTMRQIAHEVLMSLQTEFPDVENRYLPPYVADSGAGA